MMPLALPRQVLLIRPANLAECTACLKLSLKRPGSRSMLVTEVHSNATNIRSQWLSDKSSAFRLWLSMVQQSAREAARPTRAFRRWSLKRSSVLTVTSRAEGESKSHMPSASRNARLKFGSKTDA